MVHVSGRAEPVKLQAVVGVMLQSKVWAGRRQSTAPGKSTFWSSLQPEGNFPDPCTEAAAATSGWTAWGASVMSSLSSAWALKPWSIRVSTAPAYNKAIERVVALLYAATAPYQSLSVVG